MEDKIKEMLKKHEMWANGEGGGERANFSFRDLRGAILTGAILRGADLRGADLEGANLTGADFYRANLIGANLEGANLCRANLYRADLRGANLIRADLRRVNLEGANLVGANLRGANLDDIKINEATKGLSHLLNSTEKKLEEPSKEEFKRGDIVEVWDDPKMWDAPEYKKEAIFIAEAKGAKHSYIVVMSGDEGKFKRGEVFEIMACQHCKKITPPSIEITVKINGKEVNLSDVSKETLLKLREAN